MEPNEKLKLDINRVLVTAGIVLLAAGIVGGTTWYVMDKSAKEIKTADDKTVTELQKQIDDLKTGTAVTTTTPTITTTSTTSQTQQDETAVRKVVADFEAAYKAAYLGQSSTERTTLLNNMFGYMTDPTSQSDKDLKSTLIYGKDTTGNLGGPTLFSTGGTDRYPLSFEIKDLTKRTSDYIATVIENKKYYANGGNSPGYYTADSTSSMLILKVNNTWKIESYTNNVDLGKYTGFQL